MAPKTFTLFIQKTISTTATTERLRECALMYISKVKHHMQTYGEAALLKDRPNSHRLLQLAVHTVPLFGHGKLTSELVLELTHSFFKGWFKQNTHSSAHISGLDLFTYRMWSSNVFMLHHMWKNGTEEEQVIAISNLFRLFFGQKAWDLYSADSNNPDVQDLMCSFKRNLDTMMREPVDRMLQGSIPIGFLTESVTWLPKNKIKENIDLITMKAFQQFSYFLNVSTDKLSADSIHYERAALTIRGNTNISVQDNL